MAVKHYAHQYAIWLTDEKIADGNVSSDNSDVEDYFPLIHRGANGAMANAGARRRAKQVRFCFNICFARAFVNPPLSRVIRTRTLSRGTQESALSEFSRLDRTAIGTLDRSDRSRAGCFLLIFSFFFFFFSSRCTRDETVRNIAKH